MEKESFRSGFVNIIGRPNVGKSTLLNALMDKKMSIVTNKAQTTRHRLLAIWNEDNMQVVFSDTPGIIRPAYGLQKRMMGFVKEAMDDADVLIIMTDITESPEVMDEYMAFKKAERLIKQNQIPVFLIINKLDLAKNSKELDRLFDAWDIALSSLRPEGEQVSILPISAKNDANLDALKKQLLSTIPEGPAYYPQDMDSNRMESFFISEIIREKIFLQFKQEVPYSCEVVVVATEEEEDIYRIDAEIVVSQKSHQPIIVGSKGSGIKQIGILARQDLENFLDKKVFLQLKVKTRENWKDRDIFLNQYGYRS